MESQAVDETLASKYHPLFSSPEADMVLASEKQTLYRVPSFTLRATSAFFRSVLPPTPSAAPTPTDISASQRSLSISTVNIGSPFPTGEPDEALETLLRMICGLEIPRWTSFDTLEAVLNLAHRWECPGPLAIIQSGITAPVFLADPLRLYAVSTRMNWVDEAKIASTHTLGLSLYSAEHAAMLERISVKPLLALLKLHRLRRDELRRVLNTQLFSGTGYEGMMHRCASCGTMSNNGPWREFKFAMFLEMDHIPSGATILGRGTDNGVEDWTEAKACWDAKCEKEGCGEPKYDRREVLRRIKKGIAELPTKI